ncbi:MAG: hypothetical protein IJT14_00490 [Rickettsiales bacterium]|nr:hypothetical protein [Rickettsiales bacterium]
MSDETKSIIFCYLALFALVVIPIDIDGCFRTIRIIQDNIRPFVVAFITLSVTIYLKIYNDVEKKHNDDIEKFKKVFHNAYEKLQKDIKICQDCNLDQDSAEKQGVEFEGQKIKTKLRYLMQHKKINKKCDFLSFHENYLLWKKPEQMYACDCILENGQNLLQDCINEIIFKNPNDDGIKFDYACFEEIHFRNLDIKRHKDGRHEINLSITKADFRYANFSNSKISFDCEYEDDYGWFDCFLGAPHPALFENSEIYFSCKISKGENNELVFLFPQLTYIKTKKSNFHFNICCFGWYNEGAKKSKYYTEIINYINQLLGSCGRDAEETCFTFDFESIYPHSENDLYNKLKDIEKKYNKANEKLKNKVEFVMGR